MTPTRARALDAAIELLGTEGLRALTHARIDERAGLPKGSTSNYFRTRGALLSGVVDWIVEAERPSVDFVATTVEEFVDALGQTIEFLTGVNRVRTTARLVLFLEASHDPSLRTKLAEGRAALEAMVVPALARLGASDPQAAALAVAACSEGLILHRIARHDDTDPRPTIELVVKAALLG
jgi:DNA-binding transcriptional regulator YbjK